ncbi:glycerophosphodiester phosphodiesterase [Deinococcus sp. KSM4-11]|uniref:glycerophosphodiester phosphodiesterase n=1 Tax=Deinococcus sp. KSM4-11 TaxID=2568654 RepID=UPI0010A49007|nr:glycerophosphodiester phosphodiesterase [Deinococcus sp. KSM4-11]THF86754.1 glycerophosphodiester phosphodiesterase [Deinococcus sp. KSM4-11]
MRTTNPYLIERRAAGVLTTAHGGASWAAGPNTLEALRAALEIQPDYVELDVHLTRDGQLLLWHDGHIVTPDGGHAIADHTLAELRTLSTPDGTVITLHEAAEEVRGVSGLLIDLKAPALQDALLDFITAQRVEDVIVCGGYVDTLLALKAGRPGVAVSLTPDAETYRTLASSLRHLHTLDAVTVYWRTVNRAMVDAAHALGVLLLAWTVDHGPVAEHLLALGVDGLTSNNMSLLRALKRRDAQASAGDPRLTVPGFPES